MVIDWGKRENEEIEKYYPPKNEVGYETLKEMLTNTEPHVKKKTQKIQVFNSLSIKVMRYGQNQ